MASASQEVVRKFTKRLQTAVDYHQELMLAVHLKKHQASLETMLAEQFVLNAAVLWEVFLSDLLMAYLVTSPVPYLKSLKQRVLQSVKERFGSDAARFATIKMPKSLSLSKANALADPKNFNVTVNSAEMLTRRANELLAAQHAKRFTLQTDDAQFLDFVIAIRNYLGHRSAASLRRFQETLATLGGKNASLHATTSNVGAYLKTRTPAGDPRSVVIGRRLIEVATSLA